MPYTSLNKYNKKLTQQLREKKLLISKKKHLALIQKITLYEDFLYRKELNFFFFLHIRLMVLINGSVKNANFNL